MASSQADAKWGAAHSNAGDSIADSGGESAVCAALLYPSEVLKVAVQVQDASHHEPAILGIISNVQSGVEESCLILGRLVSSAEKSADLGVQQSSSCLSGLG